VQRLAEPESRPTAQLGALERRLGVAHDRVGLRAIVGEEPDPDAGGQGEPQRAGRARLGHRVERAPCRGLGATDVGGGQQQREAVAADAGEMVAGVQALAQPLGGRDQDPVADLVAQAVVDLGEAVEIDQQQRQRPVAAARAFQRLRQQLDQAAAVAQPGQRIGGLERLDPAPSGQQRGPGAECPDPAARLAEAALRLGHPLEHLPRAQRQQVGRLHHGCLFEREQALPVGLGVGDAARHRLPHRRVVALGQQVIGQPPDPGEAPVERPDPAREVGDQDAVGGRFERRRQLGRRLFAGLRLALRLAAVLHRHQVAQPLAGHCSDAADPARHRQSAAGSVDHEGLRLELGEFAAAHLVPERDVLGGGDQAVGAHPAQCGGVEPQQRARRGVGRQNPQRRRVDDPGRVGQGVEQRLPGRRPLARTLPPHAHRCAAGAAPAWGSKK
jgi:hypothetical protein